MATYGHQGGGGFNSDQRGGHTPPDLYADPPPLQRVWSSVSDADLRVMAAAPDLSQVVYCLVREVQDMRSGVREMATASMSGDEVSSVKSLRRLTDLLPAEQPREGGAT